MVDRRGEEFVDQRETQFPADLRPAGDNLSAEKSLADFKTAPAGEPNQKFDVRSIYDSRPVNAYDFNLTEQFTFTGPASSKFVIFTVPEGYVAITRKWYHRFYPTPMSTVLDDILLTPQVDEIDVANNIEIPIGAESDAVLETFFIADEFQRVGFRIQSTNAIPNPGEGNNLSVRVYGNFLLKRNIPALFEVANPCGGCGEVVRQAPLPPKNIPLIAPPAPPPAIQPAPTQKECPPGYTMFKGKCIPCPPGTVWDPINKRCVVKLGLHNK